MGALRTPDKVAALVSIASRLRFLCSLTRQRAEPSGLSLLSSGTPLTWPRVPSSGLLGAPHSPACALWGVQGGALDVPGGAAGGVGGAGAVLSCSASCFLLDFPTGPHTLGNHRHWVYIHFSSGGPGSQEHSRSLLPPLTLEPQPLPPCLAPASRWPYPRYRGCRSNGTPSSGSQARFP